MSVNLLKHTLYVNRYGDRMRTSPDKCCKACGSNNVTYGVIPANVQWATLIPAMPFIDCHYCGKRTS